MTNEENRRVNGVSFRVFDDFVVRTTREQDEYFTAERPDQITDHTSITQKNTLEI